MTDLTHEEAHRLAREKAINPFLYGLLMVLLKPLLRLVFRMHISGASNVPATGPVVIAPNHKSFWDSFFIAVALRRRVHFMGKAELFTGVRGRLFLALGGFPVKRGESDAEAIATAQAILARGDVLSLFPEGTRVRDPDALGVPRRGAARLAIEAGAPMVPAALTGTEKRRLPLPRRVQVSFGEPIPVADLTATPEDAASLIDGAVWPAVTEDYARLKARPGLVAGALVAAGLGYAVYRRRR